MFDLEEEARECQRQPDDSFDKPLLNGVKMEKHIIKHFGLAASTKKENIEDDIDAWDYKRDKSISIKTQHTALKTGNIALEFLLFNGDDSTIRMDSWFRVGKADEYWIVVGNHIAVFDAKKLKEFVNATPNKWRKTKLTNKQLIGINIMQGRKYNQSLCYLVPIESVKHLVKRKEKI